MTAAALDPEEFRAAVVPVLEDTWSAEALEGWCQGDRTAADDARRELWKVGLGELLASPDADENVVRRLGLVLAEECGRVLFPLPLYDSLVLAPRVLAAVGSPEADEWLEQIVAGELLAVAPLAMSDRARSTDVADLVIVTNHTDVAVVPTSDVRSRPRAQLDLVRPMSSISFDPVAARTAEGSVELSQALVADSLRGGAATLIGIGRQLLTRTVNFTRTRVQFGMPIAAFQAVQHRLVDVHMELQLARSLTFDTGSRTYGYIDAAAAKLQAVRAARLANVEALQFHGAMGFSWENDLQYWLKHGKAIEGDTIPVSRLVDQIASFCLETWRDAR